MGHQITQIARTENGGKYKVSISIPFELGWIERVKLNITTRTQKNVYPMQHIKNEGDMAYFETTIELPRYAVYHYYFSFEANSRFQYYKKENTSGDNSVTNEECWKLSVNFDVPEWAKGAIMYQIFVDRYKRTRGLEKKPMKGRDIHENWNEPPVVGPNEKGQWCVDFYCGDVKGITDTMKYIKKLGVDIIYLCPISESQSNHRYDTSDYRSIDPYAGTSELVKEMCEKAHKYGMGMVAVRNSSHYGIAGYWTGLAAKENMIGISGTNARPSVAPTFGVENMLGTNPLTFSMPTDEPFPFTLDCATSVIQNGKIEYYARINHDTPKGLVISREGEELTDSAEILKKIRSQQAALAPLGGFGETTGGYKGYGYSTVVEILSAALQSGLFLKALDGKDEEGKIRPYHLGHFFIAIDTEAFMGAEAFKKTCGDILRDLRGSEKAPGQERIYTAGEKEYDVWMYRKDKGVPVTEAVQKEFIGLRDEFGLTQFKFPFEK